MVAEEPEASPELTRRAISVAAQSHPVTRKPRPDVARQVDERAEELLNAQLPWLKEKTAQRREELREAQLARLQERRALHRTMLWFLAREIQRQLGQSPVGRSAGTACGKSSIAHVTPPRSASSIERRATSSPYGRCAQGPRADPIRSTAPIAAGEGRFARGRASSGGC